MKKIKMDYYIIFISTIAAFLGAFYSSVSSIILPSLASEFGMSNILQNWVATVFLLAIAIFSVPAGKLSERYGLKKSLAFGFFVFLIGSIGSALAFSSFSLLLFRVFQGIGGGILSITSLAMVVKILPPKERGKGVGINVAGAYIGLSLAPVLGGILTYNFGWRSVFYFIIPLVFFVLILTIFKVNTEWKISEKESFDKIGSLLFGMGILFFIYGFTIIHQLTGILIIIIGLLLLILFVYWELKQKYPVFNVYLFKNLKFSSSNIASLISYFATFVITYVLNYYLQYIRGMDSQTAGFFLIVTPVLMAIISPLSGRLSDKINPQKLAAIGMSLVSIALFILCFLNDSLPLYIIVFAMILQGVGYGLFVSPNTNSIMSSVPKKETSMASAAVSTMRVIGQTLSLGLLTVIFAIIMGDVEIVPANYDLLLLSSQIACIIATILCVCAVFASVIGLKSKDKYNT
ncbi:MFS transporter [Methanobrevibacter sp. OttesenSCG-928-K11]|nr:MFS transporter [Methanobrevibacter sp. OttesenSCG-928-K11]